MFRFLQLIYSAAALAVIVAAPCAGATPMDAVPPLPRGPNAVACNNVAQDFSRLPPGDLPSDYWEGHPGRYVTDLLAEPASSMIVGVPIPDDHELFGSYRGQTYPYLVLVCYPTPASNPRPDYVLPTGGVVPHMQRAGDAPVFADAAARYPVLLFSHGLAGSPISGAYLEVLAVFASWGYAVVAPFHGDTRYADIDLDGFKDYVYALLHMKDFVAMQAVRPLSLSRALDAVLADPGFAAHVDPDRVGGFGASLGGESLLLMAGAQLTTTIGQSSKSVEFDPRLGAAVGYVPYFGRKVFPAFGRDNKGLTPVRLPFLAISGTADTTAPIGAVDDGFQFLTSTRQLVALEGVEHGFAVDFTDDIFTWSLVFLTGQLSGDEVARATSARMTAVAGGGDDRQLIDYMAPSAERSGERIAIEYFNDSLGHYFITAEPAEAASLDAGAPVAGWHRSGFDFKVRPAGDPRGRAACRFFGTPGIGPNSHFYTIDSDECAKVKADPFWTYESIAFNADAPIAGDCPDDRIPVIRVYNNGIDGQASHRYTTSRHEVRQLVDAGWGIEGTVFCAIP
ncbi:MAG: hypothetical protein IT521_10760 [Burkholderiales bacterium]|nr:hypothetical protein [Burkholderiales bacterium]